MTRVYEREALHLGPKPELQNLVVRIQRADGAIAQYKVSTYLAYVEQKRYGRPRQKGLTMTIGWDRGPGLFEPIRKGREVSLGKRKAKR